MTTFNKSGDPAQQNDQGQGASFGADQSQDNGNGGDEGSTVTQAQLAGILKRLDDKDAYIQQLQDENKAMREAQSETPSMEDIMERLNQGNQQQQQPQQEPVDVDALVQQATEAATNALTAKQQAEQRKDNFNKVQSILANKFGDNVDADVRRLAAENDMTFDEAIEMAETKPNVLIKLFGLNGQQSGGSGSPTPTTPSMNSYQYANQQNQNQQPPKLPNIMEARTDRERIAIAKQAFEDRGLDFEYV